MSKLVIDKSTLDGIGDAIREKTGISDLIPVIELSEKILEISGGSTNIAIDEVEVVSDVSLNNTKGWTIYHSLEKTPDIVFIYSHNETSVGNYIFCNAFIISDNISIPNLTTTKGAFGRSGWGASTENIMFGNWIPNRTLTEESINFNTGSAGCNLKVGRYTVISIAI